MEIFLISAALAVVMLIGDGGGKGGGGVVLLRGMLTSTRVIKGAAKVLRLLEKFDKLRLMNHDISNVE